MSFKLLQLKFMVFICLHSFYDGAMASPAAIIEYQNARMDDAMDKAVQAAQGMYLARYGTTGKWNVATLFKMIFQNTDKPGTVPPEENIGSVNKLPPVMYQGTYVKIGVLVPPGVNSFEIGFHEGPTTPQGEVDFHMAVRLDEKTIVFSRVIDGKWQMEQIEYIFPNIEVAKMFDITITLKEHSFDIAIIDKVYDFGYRKSLINQRLNFLVITADIWVYLIQLGNADIEMF